MKQYTSVMFMLLFSFAIAAQEPQPKGLDPYIGKDLRKLDEGALEKYRILVDVITGDKPEKKQWGSFEPWWVKPFAGGKAAWIYLEAYPGYDVPDVSAIQVHIFDKTWKRLAKQTFPTGYRFFLNDVSIVSDNPLKQDLLAAKVTSTGPFMVQGDKKRPAFEQGDFQLQYYALLSDQFVLVRLEDNKKGLVQNHYRWRAPPKGPAVPKRTRNEWIHDLSSTNPVEQLIMMAWLSGTHLPSKDARSANVNQESVEDSKLYEEVRDSAETKKALQELINSTNSWVQEYAKFTLQVISK